MSKTEINTPKIRYMVEKRKYGVVYRKFKRNRIEILESRREIESFKLTGVSLKI